MAKAGMTYAGSGVDIDIEEQAAKIMYEAAKQTWATRKDRLGEVIVPFDDYSGIRAINVGQLPAGTVMNIGFDGVGTKAELAIAANRYDTLGYDLMAMVCDDAVVRGAEPIVMGSILDTNSLGTDDSRLDIVQELAKGYMLAAKAANVAVINGEIAQLGDLVGGGKGFGFNWGSALVWFAHQSKMITGHKIKLGDHVVGLREPGFRSNGFSLLRKILKDKFGDDWTKQDLDGANLLSLALRPSVIYCKAVSEMFGGWNPAILPKVNLHGVAHITGSGLPGKLGRVLKPTGLGAKITDTFQPAPLMLHAQRIGTVSDSEAYRTWNMGQGMVLITPDADMAVAVAKKHGIEAKVIGQITKEPEIVIANQGIGKAKDPWLTFKS
ncbi:MAG TPA: AIR synthase-related protein [Candidatus Saccharimonadales bacterium]|nr:AIR synthase-related protein [Candidatus Saccharimonadales bacterium]